MQKAVLLTDKKSVLLTDLKKMKRKHLFTSGKNMVIETGVWFVFNYAIAEL